jgi:hypothetical protein
MTDSTLSDLFNAFLWMAAIGWGIAIFVTARNS